MPGDADLPSGRGSGRHPQSGWYRRRVTFTERNFPPPERAENRIPDGVRVSLLGSIAEMGIASPTDLWEDYCRHEGYAEFEEIAEDIGNRFGADSRDVFVTAMQEHFKRQKRRSVWSAGVNYEAEPALRALPTPQFLDVLEMAAVQRRYEPSPLVDEINRLFARRGVNYRFSPAGQAEWHGDAGAFSAVVTPALDALSDSRLAGAEAEFSAALRHLRLGTAKDLEDAVEEAAKSVESAMKVVCAANGVKLKGKETASPLHKELVNANIVPAASDQAVLGASRLRNAHGGHGSGAQPRVVDQEVAELTVRSAASAVAFLGTKLP